MWIPALDVSIRQHTSAYVSIRQHTSAYVSIRQQTRRVLWIPALDVSRGAERERPGNGENPPLLGLPVRAAGEFVPRCAPFIALQDVRSDTYIALYHV